MSRLSLNARVAMESGTWRCMGASPTRAEALGYRRCFESSGVSFAAQSLAHQEPVGGDAETYVVMEAAPVSPFVVMQSELGLQFLIVALDSPAPLSGGDEGLPCTCT